MNQVLEPPFENIDDSQDLDELSRAIVESRPEFELAVHSVMRLFHEDPNPGPNSIDNYTHMLEELF